MKLKTIGKHLLIASGLFLICLVFLMLLIFAINSGYLFTTSNGVDSLLQQFQEKSNYLFFFRSLIYVYVVIFLSPKLANKSNYETKSIQYLVIGLCLVYEIIFIRSVGLF